jgi:eukaryotic-like serine/threonine-protein kinase
MECLGENTIARLVHNAADEALATLALKHLDSCATCREVVAQVLVESDEGASLVAPFNQLRLKPGARIGRYVVLERLARGGMGVVFAAYDPELARQVAIKLVRADTSSKRPSYEAQDSLLNEARALARLKHPNVLTVHDVGTIGVQVFVALELVDGSTLRQWLRSQPRTTGQKLEVLAQAGRGLAAAHAKGIVHRDFKPENVLVGDDQRVRVMDLGLSNAATPIAGSASERSRTGGTIGYLAPEQARGGATDARSDQFSFCVTVVEALTGQRVATAAEAQALAIPRRLKRVVKRGLAGAPDARYVSLDVLLADFERAISPRRWRAVLAATLAIVAVGLLASVLRRDDTVDLNCERDEAAMRTMWAQAPRAALMNQLKAAPRGGADIVGRIDAYVTRWRQLHADHCAPTVTARERSAAVWSLRDACLQQAAREVSTVVTVLTSNDGTTKAQASAGADLLDLALCADSAALSHVILLAPMEQRPQAAKIQKLLAETKGYSASGNFSRARQLGHEALAEANTLGFRPLLAEAKFALGVAHKQLGEHVEAVRALDDAADDALATGHDAVAADAWIELMKVVGYRQGKIELGLHYARLATVAIERLGRSQDADLKFGQALALVLQRGGNHADAEVLLRRVIAKAERVEPKDELRVGASLMTLASTLHERGDYHGAADTRRKALEICERLQGAKAPLVGQLLAGLAESETQLGQNDAARAHAAQAAAMSEEVRGAESFFTAVTWCVQGEVESTTKHVSSADALFARCLKVTERNAASDPLLHAQPLASWSAHLARSGKVEQAQRSARHAVELFERSLGPDHPQLLQSLTLLSTLAFARADVAAAIAWGRRATALANGRANDTSTCDQAAAAESLARALQRERLHQAEVRAFALAAVERYSRCQAAFADDKRRALVEWLATAQP